jgi:Ca2+/Na+ antiporter
VSPGSLQPIDHCVWACWCLRRPKWANTLTVAPSVVVFVVGAVLSLAMRWVLVTRLERVGERLGFSEASLGMVAALAADTPEITASITAIAHHQQTVGAGGVLGSMSSTSPHSSA